MELRDHLLEDSEGLGCFLFAAAGTQDPRAAAVGEFTSGVQESGASDAGEPLNYEHARWVTPRGLVCRDQGAKLADGGGAFD